MKTAGLYLGWAPHMPGSRLWAVSKTAALPLRRGRLLGSLGGKATKDRDLGHEEGLALGTGTFAHSSLPDSQELWPTVCNGGPHPQRRWKQ